MLKIRKNFSFLRSCLVFRLTMTLMNSQRANLLTMQSKIKL